MEVQDELQNDEVLNDELSEDPETYSEITSEDLMILNNNIITGALYITGALGIICGILIGRAFNGIFRSK